MADAVNLEKAHFINRSEGGSGPFYVQFNPKELKLDDRANYSPDSGSQDGTRQDFNGRDGAKLSMELIFDTTIGSTAGANVNETFIQPLRNFLALADSQPGATQVETQTSEPRPPPVEFRWGPFAFEGVIDSVNTTFLMFSAGGVPLRARVAVSMTTDERDETGAGSRRDQSRLLPPLVRSVPADLGAGSSLGSMAERFGVSEKLIAEANNIDDPLSIGDTLSNLRIPDTAEIAQRLRNTFRDIAPKNIGPFSQADVVGAVAAVGAAKAAVDQARQVVQTVRTEGQRLVGEANQTVGELNAAAGGLTSELPNAIQPSAPEIPDVPDIPDFEPPF